MTHYETTALCLECTSLCHGWPLGREEQCEFLSSKELFDFLPCWVAPRGHACFGPCMVRLILLVLYSKTMETPPDD